MVVATFFAVEGWRSLAGIFGVSAPKFAITGKLHMKSEL
jgi:hypothetical protein